MVVVMQPWYRDTVVSVIQRLKDFVKDAVFAVFPVVFDDEIYRYAGDLVFACLYSVVLIGVNDV